MSKLSELIQKLKDKILQREKIEEKPVRPEEFKEALQFVLKWEGFISYDPNDPGGMTIWGISYRSHKDAVLEMEKLINEQKKDEAFVIAEKIYYENYWLKSECDTTIFPFNIIVFDTAVNCGISKAKELFDECFSYNADENLGTYSWQDYLLKRIDFYTKCEKANIYLRGWVNRVIDLYKYIKNKDKDKDDIKL